MTSAAAVGAPGAWQPSPMPRWLADLDEDQRMVFDVRDELASGLAPFARIITALSELPRGHALVLRTLFEPIPLYGVLARRGFARWTECRAPDDWCVWFWQADAPRVARTAAGRHGGPAVVVDLRGLEVPRPATAVLRHLETLGAGEILAVLHDRWPLFLYPQLEARGFSHETDEPAPGVVRIRIWREGADA